MFILQRQHQHSSGVSLAKGQKPVATELDIVGIPAIGADGERTWGETESTQWLGPRLRAHFPRARILLWDHLTEEDRAIVPGYDHQNLPTDAYQDAGRRFGRMRMQDWADRFLNALEAERSKAPKDRPIVFICHSTGGIVLKEALCRKPSLPLVAACLGITFFATPHHGSNVLSLAACADTIKERLNLKWPLGSQLREQLAPQSPYLELLNQRFAARIPGIEIWSYCEEGVLPLEVRTELLPQKFRSNKRLRLSDPVVDKRSAWITKSDNSVLIDEEIPLSVNADHVTLPRLEEGGGGIDLQTEYLGELKKMIAEQDLKDRSERQKVLSTIFEQVRVGIFEFYNEVGRAMGPVNAMPPRQVRLRDFLDPNVELGLDVVELPTIEGAALLLADANAATSNNQPQSPNSTVFDVWKEVVDANRGRGDRLQVTDTSTQPRRLSTSRLITRSRSRTRSVADEDLATRSPGGAAPEVSGQQLDSILVTGSSTPPRKEAPFTWIHTPYCVSSWVPQILSVVSSQKRIPNLHQRLTAREHWMIHQNRARHAASHAQYMRPHFETISTEDSSSMVIPGLPSPPSAEQIPDKVQFALFVPFLHWDTFKMQQRRSKVISIRDTQENPRLVERGAIDKDNLEHHVLWQYLLSESPVHPRRSLDQYGYPALRNTEVRDADQILYKKTRSHNIEQGQASDWRSPRQRLAARLHFATSKLRKSEHSQHHQERPPTVLAVDTLWLWILRQDTLVTFASKREHGDEDAKMSKQADMINSAYKSARQDKLKDCYDLAALIVNKCVTTLLDEASDPHLHVFHIFEEYLSDLTEDYTNSFKLFRNMQRPDINGLDDNAQDPSDADPTDTYASRKDLYHLFELRDITDELTTLRKLFSEQQKQINVMRDEFRSHLQPLSKGNRAIELLNEALEGLDAYVESVDTMLKSSDAMQSSYEKLLTMKTAKVNVDEAHAARKQTEVSTQQSKTVTIFTIVTIIFSPLSFMSSLFGMNVSEWSGVPTNLELYFVIKVLSCVSFGVITLSLLIAFNKLTRILVRWAWSWLKWMFVGLLNFVGLGWVVGSMHRRMHRSVSRVPGNAFSWQTQRKKSTDSAYSSRPPQPLSTAPTLGPMDIGDSSASMPTASSAAAPRMAFWRRRVRNRAATEVEDDVELAKDEPVSPTTTAHAKSPPEIKHPEIFAQRPSGGRASVVFGQVTFDRQTRAKVVAGQKAAEKSG